MSESPASLRQLRRAALVGPLLLLVVSELAHWALQRLLSPWTARLLALAVTVALLAFLYDRIFSRVERLENRLLRQNQELIGLHVAGLAITADLSLDTVLQTVVDRACALLATRYGAISVIDEGNNITNFVTSGIDPALREAIGDPPHGRGVLGVAIREGQRLRLDDITAHPRSVGFPANHPPMRSLLAIPISCEGPYRGNLYLSEKLDGGIFTADDEDVLARFASQAAVAIDNAFFHRQVRELGAARERLRIAHEMHDGLAQVLAYVNTKAQVVREYLRQGKIPDAQKHLDEFAEAARNLYGDVRQQILELRTVLPEEGGLPAAVSDYALAWGAQTGVEVQLEMPESLALPTPAQRQLLRIVQEALTNVRKHARASRVLIELAVHEQELRLCVEDDGVGFESESAAAGRFGLKTMHERAATIGARLEVSARPDAGVRIQVRLPLVAARHDAEPPPPPV
jgi:signal transduction histidine kinase